MFKIESFITPYILAYLDKYIKNFNPADFQVSLWGGGAAFTNLNLNLDVLDEEFNLPVSFVSGHIHELRITVPWTKLYSDPIVISVNTIELSLRLKSQCKDYGSSGATKPSSSKDVLVVSKDPAVPTSYLQSLLNKLFTNIRFQFENVIVKYVEEDIVLSLNVMKMCMFTVDSNWKGAFVDLVAPDYILRKKVEVSDLTICLDKCNSAGKIDAYQEPLLYKCSFNVRIMQKYRSPQAKQAYFSRSDFLIDKMEFSVTNEQVPMLMRLYTLMVTLTRVNLKTMSLSHPKWISPQSFLEKTGTSSTSTAGANDLEDQLDNPELPNDEESGVLNWASWAVNSVSSVMFGDYEEEDESASFEEPELNFQSHIAFYVNNATITFKAFERVYDKSGYDRRTIKVKFLPFLKVRLQGIMHNWSSSPNEISYNASISEMGVEGIGFCPCGVVDCSDNEKEQDQKIRDRNLYLTMGKETDRYIQGSLFVEVKEKSADESEEDLDRISGEWSLSETLELINEGKHAFAMEYNQVTKEPKYDKTADDSDELDSGFTDVDISSVQLSQRMFFGPLHLIVNSGLIHRLKMIHYSVKVYNYEPYDHVQNYFSSKIVSTQEPNFKYLHNFSSAFDTYEIQFIKPVIEVYASDHPDYDINSRHRHTLRRRRMTTTTPLSFVIDNWPKLLISINQVNMKLRDPNMKFKAVVEKCDKNTPRAVLEKFKRTSEILISDTSIDMKVGGLQRNVAEHCSGLYHEDYFLRMDLQGDKSFKPSWTWGLKSDEIRVHASFPQLLLLKILYLSYYNEAISEHLTFSTILEDQSLDYPTANILISRFQYTNVIATFTTSKKVAIGDVAISIENCDSSKPVPVFVSHPKSGEDLMVCMLQRCSSKPDKLTEGSAKFYDVASTPIFLADISKFEIEYNECIIAYLNYKSKAQQTTIPLAVRMAKEVMAPMTPLSRSDAGYSVGKSGVLPSSAASVDATSLSGTDFQALFKSKTSSRVTESHGSSFNYISDKVRQNLSNLELEDNKAEEQVKEEVQSFERWIVEYLSEIKNTLTIINIAGVEFWFPLQCHNLDVATEKSNGVVLSLGKASLQPRGIKQWIAITEHKLPISVPIEIKGRDLYPLLISLEDMRFSTLCEKGEKHDCSAPLSVVATFSLTQKLAEGKSPIIAAYLHCDISSYKLSFSHPQVRVIRKLVQKIIYSLLSFTKENGSLATVGSLPTLSTQNVTFGSQENLNSAASDTSAYIESIISHSKGQTTSSSLKRNSITPSPPAVNKLSLPDEEDPLPAQASEVIPLENCETKATLWLQITLTQFQVVIFNSTDKDDYAPQHKLVLEINDVLSSLDFQSVFVKWNLKVTNFSLRSYKRNGKEWDHGDCLGVVVSSGDDVTRAIHIVQCPKTNNAIVTTSGSSSPVPHLPSASSASKIRGILVLTFTSVLSNNFHKKADVPSPVSRWVSTIEKYHDKNYDDYMPFEKADERCLHEIDIILRSMDFVICPSVFKPFDKILQEFLSFHIPKNILATPGGTESCSIPYLNNNSMPLVYLQTETFRIFLNTKADHDQSLNCTDGAVIQFSAINLQSQSENALHRTKIRPHLYSMAERARILNIPGSPVEDRQYQIDFHGFSISTFKWMDLENCSRRMPNKRPSAILKTQGENPALDWNNMLGDHALDEVEAQPLLDRLEICLNFAPAIVYDRSPGVSCKSLVVAGYSAELNFTNDTSLFLNLNQLHFMKNFLSEASLLANQCSPSPMEENCQTDAAQITKSLVSNESQCNNLSFGVDTSQPPLANILTGPGHQDISPSADLNLPHYESNKISTNTGIDEGNEAVKIPIEQDAESNPHCENKKEEVVRKRYSSDHLVYRHRHLTDKVPFDLLITGSALRITIYDVKQKIESGIHVTPIAYAFVGQPHLMLSTASSRHRAEASVFDLSFNLASPKNKLPKKSKIPEPSDFNLKLFESILGERNPKTGMVAPLINLNINEIHGKQFRISMEITRPLRIIVNRNRIQNFSKFVEILELSRKGSGETEIIKSGGVNPLRSFITSVEKLSVSFNQLVVGILEDSFKSPKAGITVSWSAAQFNILGSGFHKKLSKQGLALKASGNCHLDLVALSTTIGERTDVMVNPFNVNIGGKCRWKDWSDEPYSIVRGELDPLIINFGPNNILAFLQVYHGLQQFWKNLRSYNPENEYLETVGSDNTSTAFTVDVFKDDLRAGAFHYKNSSRYDELPSIYEIIFCEPQRTMTWRYPQPRALICIEASQVPLTSAQFSNMTGQKLQCVVEYWDECKKAFGFYGVLYISEDEKGQVIIPPKDKLHAYISTMWRIRLITPLEESYEDSLWHLVKPEVLAACLKVDSIYEPAFLAKLRANIITPLICVNLMNHLYYSGKAGDERLRQYTMGGMSFDEQPFATIDISTNSLMIGSWINQSSIGYSGFFKMDVVDYAFLTNINVIEPIKVKLSSLYHTIPNSNTINSETNIFTNHVVVKLGASAAHTFMSSLVTWFQVLENYDGRKVDLGSFEYRKNIILSRSILCNDVCQDIALKHGASEKHIVIKSRECFGIIFPSENASLKYKIGIRDVEWKWSNAIDFNKPGSSVVIIPTRGPLFVNISPFSSSQRLINVSGCFTVGNILDQPVEVALFSRHNSTEIKWSVQTRAYGSSQMIDIKDVEHLRFRFVAVDGSNHPWSGIVTVKDLKDSPNGSVCLQLYKEDVGTLQIYNVWCSLVEEMHDGIPKYLIVVCPFFRMRSCVSFDTIAHISTSKKDTENSFVLPGKCIDMQIEFLGDFDAAHHLTFKTYPHLQASTPSIPLLPGGPAFKTSPIVRPIDDILRNIIELNCSETNNGDGASGALKWPYVNENIPVKNWIAGNHSEKEIEVVVGSEPWIEGLPSILLEAKPWALFVNMCGAELLVSDAETDKISSIPSYCAFSPKKFASRFKIGVQSPSGTFWTLPLDFTEQKFRTDVHHVNSNYKIPLDCFSRLEIHGLQEVFYMTLEAKMHKGIVILAFKPTYSVKNDTNSRLMVHGISLVRSDIQNPDDWSSISKYSVLKPKRNNKKENRDCLPLLTFSCNCDDSTVGSNGLKYLALSCEGPWWFVQLMKFELIFDNMSANIGFPAKRMAISLPKYGNLESAREMDTMATEPIVLSWMSKNGQVWISLKEDTSPQLIISNRTNVDLVYARASELTNIPCEETEHFEQYLLLPKNTKGHYTFQSSNSKFPDLNAGVKETLPTLIISRVVAEKLPSYKPIRNAENNTNALLNGAMPNAEVASENEAAGNRGTLMFSEILEWSKEIRIDGENMSQQYYRLSDSIDVKIHVERLCQSYFILIENTSSVEVSAKDIRGRISGNLVDHSNSPQTHISIQISPIPQLGNVHDVENPVFNDQIKEKFPSSPQIPERNKPLELEDKIFENRGSWEFKGYFPEVNFIITDDFPNPIQKPEFLSITFQDILVEQKTFNEKTILRTLCNQPKEISIINLKIGDFQVDSPSHGDKKGDFSVILKQETEYKELPFFENNPTEFLPYFLNAQRVEGSFMIEGIFNLTSNYPSGKRLEEVYFKLLPFSVYIEDQFLESVVPSLSHIYQVVEQNLPLFQPSKIYSPSTRLIIKDSNVKKHSNIISDGHESQSTSRMTLTGKTQSPLSQLTFPSQSDFNLSLSDMDADASSQAESFYTSVNDLDTWKQMHLSKSLIGKHHNLPQRAFNVRPQPAALFEDPSSGTEKDDSVAINDIFEDTESVMEFSWLPIQFVDVPPDVITVLHQFSNPIWLRKLSIDPCDMFVTFRMFRTMYLAVDHSPMHMDALYVYSLHTTSYGLGQSIAAHYFKGAVFQVKNPLRLIGSMELLGSPGSLARSVGTGLRDFVVYPYQGLFHGPTGFLSGLTHGFSSLLKNVTAGTLTSVTNWAWSVSRNIDKFTLDKDEQIFTEEGRRVEVEGFTDGLIQGFTGFGIRLLGAVGGIAHHPIQNVIERGATPSSVISGVGKGIIGVVTKPIGGAVELVAMTGQGLLRGAGWTPRLKMKHDIAYVEYLDNCSNSLLKLRWRLYQNMEGDDERLLLVVDATRLSSPRTSDERTFVSCLLTTHKLYVMTLNNEDSELFSFPILQVDVDSNENVVTVTPSHSKRIDEISLAEERIIEFVRGSSDASSPPTASFKSDNSLLRVFASGINEGMAAPNSPSVISSIPPSPQEAQAGSSKGGAYVDKSDRLCTFLETDPLVCGHYMMSDIAKTEFVSTFTWAKMNQNDLFFRLC